MPYVSKNQAAYFNIHKKQLESKGVNVDEWNKATKGATLPRTVGAKGKKLPKKKKK